MGATLINRPEANNEATVNREDEPLGKTTAAAMCRHPMAVRILEALNTRDEMSPSQFLNSGLSRGLPGLGGKKTEGMMSDVSSQFRALRDADCIELVATRKGRRGAPEHFYRAKARAYFTDAEWLAMGMDERAAISKTMLRGFIAQAEGAMLMDTFDSRLDRWVAWLPFNTDQQGWDEVISAIRTAFTTVDQVRQDSGLRLIANGSTPIPLTFGIFGFESPPMGDSPTIGDDSPTPISTE
jgi:hypothetical protein